MENDLINICYEGDSGESDIRSMYIDNILHFSLSDVYILLNKENRQMGESNAPRFIPNLIKSQLTDLEEDEYTKIANVNPTPGHEIEVFVTQPGLNRVMGTDSSPAGRKFQRWLYHDVVPSLTKHGIYPPPATTQGSALAQMAEIVAQNSRALADSIAKQEQLEQEVNIVKGDISNVENRVAALEKDNSENEFILSVRSWFDKSNIALTSSKELDIVVWCENLCFRYNKRRIPCPSGKRVRAKFHQEIIEKARHLVEESQG